MSHDSLSPLGCVQYLCYSKAVCKEPSKCISLLCLGRFFHTVIAGWDDHECIRAFEVITHTTHMMKNLHTIVNAKPGKSEVIQVK